MLLTSIYVWHPKQKSTTTGSLELTTYAFCDQLANHWAIWDII